MNRFMPIVAQFAVLSLLFGCAGTREGNAPTRWYPMTNERSDPVSAVFESRLPCLDSESRSNAGCQRVKFALALYRDAATEAPTTFLMSRVFVGTGDRVHVIAGSWTVVPQHTAGASSQVIKLDDAAPLEFRSFLFLTPDVIFVLDADGAPRLGDAGHGYALNRTL